MSSDYSQILRIIQDYLRINQDSLENNQYDLRKNQVGLRKFKECACEVAYIKGSRI